MGHGSSPSEVKLGDTFNIRGVSFSCTILAFLNHSCANIATSINAVLTLSLYLAYDELECPGGVLPYKGLMGTCGQPGYVFRDFCLEQGIEFIIFCLNQGIDLSIFVLNWVKCLKQGVLKWVGKSAIFVLNRVRV